MKPLPLATAVTTVAVHVTVCTPTASEAAGMR
jgi:hypothetical protein